MLFSSSFQHLTAEARSQCCVWRILPYFRRLIVAAFKHMSCSEKKGQVCHFHASACWRPCSISSFPSIFRFTSEPKRNILNETHSWNGLKNPKCSWVSSLDVGCCCHVWLRVFAVFWPVAAPRGHSLHPERQQPMQKDDWPSAVAPSSAAIE